MERKPTRRNERAKSLAILSKKEEKEVIKKKMKKKLQSSLRGKLFVGEPLSAITGHEESR